jgi:preprotein translocase subunit SecG
LRAFCRIVNSWVLESGIQLTIWLVHVVILDILVKDGVKDGISTLIPNQTAGLTDKLVDDHFACRCAFIALFFFITMISMAFFNMSVVTTVTTFATLGTFT